MKRAKINLARKKKLKKKSEKQTVLKETKREKYPKRERK